MGGHEVGSGHKLQINKLVDHKSHTLKWQSRADQRQIKYFPLLFLFLTEWRVGGGGGAGAGE